MYFVYIGGLRIDAHALLSSNNAFCQSESGILPINYIIIWTQSILRPTNQSYQHNSSYLTTTQLLHHGIIYNRPRPTRREGCHC